MKYTLRMANQFKKDVKLCKRGGNPMDELWKVLNLLMENGHYPKNTKPINCEETESGNGNVI